MKTSPDLPNLVEFDRKLAFDICRCVPKANPCAEKDNCLRFIAPRHPTYQWEDDYSELLEPDKICTYMIRAGIA